MLALLPVAILHSIWETTKTISIDSLFLRFSAGQVLPLDS